MKLCIEKTCFLQSSRTPSLHLHMISCNYIEQTGISTNAKKRKPPESLWSSTCCELFFLFFPSCFISRDYRDSAARTGPTSKVSTFLKRVGYIWASSESPALTQSPSHWYWQARAGPAVGPGLASVASHTPLEAKKLAVKVPVALR